MDGDMLEAYSNAMEQLGKIPCETLIYEIDVVDTIASTANLTGDTGTQIADSLKSICKRTNKL